MPKYRLIIEYDGTDWAGWQVQPDEPTVQAAIESALTTYLRVPSVSVTGSGRTDAGVHALGQVAHLETDNPVDPFRLKGALNGLLPSSISIRDAQPVADGFHARFDAVWRQYRYLLSTEPVSLDHHRTWFVRPAPDIDAMNEAASTLLGTHDFNSFCRTQSATVNRVCTVTRAHWTAGDRDGSWHFSIRADRFLHGMVRAIVGTLVETGQGRRDVADMTPLLEARDRRLAGAAAPARGLHLEAVGYP